MTIIIALVTSLSLSFSHTGHRILAIRREQTIVQSRLIVALHTAHVIARIPERNIGNFFSSFLSLPYLFLKGKDMWSSAISKLEEQNKNGGMIMEKITISGRKNHVMERIIELMVLL